MKKFQRMVERTVAEELDVIPELAPLRSGASSKIFFRISGVLARRWRKDTLVLAWIDQPRAFSDYKNISTFFFKHNISVPKVFFTSRTDCYLILEDAGDRTLQQAVSRDDGRKEAHYRSAIDLLLKIQKLKPTARCVLAQRYFDVPKFAQEFTFHIKKYLIGARFRYILSAQETGLLRKEYTAMARVLAAQPRVPVHRDFQSSNLLLRDPGPLTVVDFQDARMGLPLYDLVSLLEDAYVSLSRELKDKLIRYYLAAADARILPPPLRGNFRQIYDWTLIQRKLHDAGAFMYSFVHLGNRKYLPYISGAVARALAVMQPYDDFSVTRQLLSSFIEHEKKTKDQTDRMDIF